MKTGADSATDLAAATAWPGAPWAYRGGATVMLHWVRREAKSGTSCRDAIVARPSAVHARH